MYMYPLSLTYKTLIMCCCPREGTGAGPAAQGLGLHLQETAGTSVRGHGPEAGHVLREAEDPAAEEGPGEPHQGQHGLAPTLRGAHRLTCVDPMTEVIVFAIQQ